MTSRPPIIAARSQRLSAAGKPAKSGLAAPFPGKRPRFKPPGKGTLSCLGKDPFADPALARKVAHGIAKRRAAKINAYKCRFCSFWHVGNARGGK